MTVSSSEGGDLGRVAVRGAGSMLTGQVLRLGLQLATVAVLSRLLTPRDYGLLAMVMVVIGFGEVFRDFGLSAAAIQAPTLLRSQRDALFWLNSAIGLGFGLVLFLAAPLVAAWFGEPDLIVMSQALSVVFLLNGLTAQYRADLNRSMRFRALVSSDIAGQAAGLAAGVTLALLGAGFWALVGQQVVAGLATFVITVAQCRWLPGRPRRGADIRHLLRYGGGLSASQFVGYLNSNIDNIVIGTQLGSVDLGLYSRGYQLLMRAVNQVRGPSTSVAVPVLTRLAGEPEKSDGFLVRGQAALGYTLVAGLAFVAAAASPIVNIVLGPGWEQVAPVVSWLAVAAAFQTISYIGYWIYLVRGLTGRLFWYSLVSLVVKVGCVLAGSAWGIVGVSVGFAVATALSWPISIAWISRITRIPTRRLYTGAGRIVLVALLIAAGTTGVIWLARGLPDLALAALGLAGGLAGYGLALLLIPPVRRDVAALIATAKRSLPGRPK